MEEPASPRPTWSSGLSTLIAQLEVGSEGQNVETEFHAVPSCSSSWRGSSFWGAELCSPPVLAPDQDPFSLPPSPSSQTPSSGTSSGHLLPREVKINGRQTGSFQHSPQKTPDFRHFWSSWAAPWRESSPALLELLLQGQAWRLLANQAGFPSTSGDQGLKNLNSESTAHPSVGRIFFYRPIFNLLITRSWLRSLQWLIYLLVNLYQLFLFLWRST